MYLQVKKCGKLNSKGIKKSFIFAVQKKGRMEIQPELYPISKSLSGLVSPRRDS
jgi:hypothetical protein